MPRDTCSPSNVVVIVCARQGQSRKVTTSWVHMGYSFSFGVLFRLSSVMPHVIQ